MPTMMRWIQILNPDRPGRRLAAIGCLAAGCLFLALSVDAAKQPNIVLIFTDDQGYNDLGCFGSKTIKTPNIDQMAKEGMRFTSFYAQAVCGPSRAALMTGCYPIRVAEPGNKKNQHTIPHTQEITVAEVLNEAGYATGCIGKWHLGQRTKGGNGWDPETMPNGQGFDYYYGTPLYNGFTVFVDDTKFRSPILRNQEIVTKSVESWDNITSDYTKEAIGFIRRNQAKPFFLYLAHNMPHIPVGASERFRGKSEYGPYGDTIEEIDWSTGEILKTLKKLKLEDDTLVVFTSDNGPWIETTRGMQPGIAPFIPTDHSGTADPLRGYKMLTWEGGLRVPCVGPGGSPQARPRHNWRRPLICCQPSQNSPVRLCLLIDRLTERISAISGAQPRPHHARKCSTTPTRTCRRSGTSNGNSSFRARNTHAGWAGADDLSATAYRPWNFTI
jgi:arylsulfatase A-like enzyme